MISFLRANWETTELESIALNNCRRRERHERRQKTYRRERKFGGIMTALKHNSFRFLTRVSDSSGKFYDLTLLCKMPVISFH